MKLAENIRTENGITVASVTCVEISNETKKALDAFPRYLRYMDIDFSSRVTVIEEDDDSKNVELVDFDDPDADLLHLSLVNKDVRIDENFSVEISLDYKKFNAKSLTTRINNMELLGRAYALIYINKIEERVKYLVQEARQQYGANMEVSNEVIL